LERSERMTPSSLEDIYVRSAGGKLVALSSMILARQQGSPNAINRFARQRSVTISAQPQGVTLGEAIARTEAILARTLPPDINYRWYGEAEEIQEGTTESIQVLILAMLIVQFL